jgi:hypothetical protein
MGYMQKSIYVNQMTANQSFTVSEECLPHHILRKSIQWYNVLT